MKYLALALALLFAGTAQAEDVWRPSTVQAIPYDTVSVRTTTAFGAHITRARVVCTTACLIALGASPGVIATAATGTLLPANVPEVFSVSPGEHFAVIRVSTTGTLYVTELTK